MRSVSGIFLLPVRNLRSFAAIFGSRCKGNFERCLGIKHQRPNDGVVLAILAIDRDQSQGFFAKAGHAGKGFDFAIGELGGLQHGALNDLAGIANEQHAFIAISLDRHLHALHHAHAREFLQQRLAFGFVGFGRLRRVGEYLLGFGLFRCNSRSWFRCSAVITEEAISAATSAGDVLRRSRSSNSSCTAETERYRTTGRRTSIGQVRFLASASATPGLRENSAAQYANISGAASVRASAASTLDSGCVRRALAAFSRIFSSESAARMASSSMRTSRPSESAPLQIASFRSRVARPDWISSRHPPLILASQGSLQSLSRDCDLARVAWRAYGSECLSI